MTGGPRRSWGYWTQAKLAILRDYLPAFLHASKGKASEFVYLDAFAGEGHGVDRLTGDQFPGSVRIALDVRVPLAPLEEPAARSAGFRVLGRIAVLRLASVVKFWSSSPPQRRAFADR